MNNNYNDEIELPVEEISRGSFRVRLETKVKNGALVEAREKLDLKPKEAAELIGVSYCSLLGCEGMRYFPGEKTINKIIGFYQNRGIPILAEDVFPEQLREAKFSSKYVHEGEIPNENLISLGDVPSNQLTYNLDSCFERNELIKEIERSLNDLNQDESYVIRHSFGINGEVEMTDVEMASALSLSRSRIGQIKEKAIRKLRLRSTLKVGLGNNLTDFVE